MGNSLFKTKISAADEQKAKEQTEQVKDALTVMDRFQEGWMKIPGVERISIGKSKDGKRCCVKVTVSEENTQIPAEVIIETDKGPKTVQIEIEVQEVGLVISPIQRC